MSYAPKYIVYKCSVCARQTELVLDGGRPDPIRCNITDKCRGKFSRVGERSVREFLFTPLVPGLSDYIPRGSTIIPAPQLTVPNPITVFTASGSGIIALAAVHRSIVGTQAIFSIINETDVSAPIESRATSVINPQSSTVRAVLFEISPALLTASKYTYVFSGPVSIVSGQDSSPESKSLRFTTVNNITVYVNGVELDPSNYDRTVDNQITMTPTIFDSNNVVEIFVYKDLTSAIDNSKQVVLEFKSLVPTISTDAALRELDCWGDYSGTLIDSVERFTLFCTDLTELNVNKSYGVAYFEATDTNNTVHKLKSSDVYMLLGKEPFAFRDKELYAYLTGASLVTDQSVLTYKESSASGSLFLTVDETAITQVFNPIILSRVIETIQETAETATAIPGTPLAGSENLHQKYILGPT